jgi:hypothetical protein
VLDVSGDVVRVRVVLERAGSGARTYVMRFDRAAQLTEVESVEGIPAAALGQLGLSEIFPAAAAAPPSRPLAPGDRWRIDDTVRLPGMDAPARLRGAGRLVELGVVDGHDTATVRSTFTVPVETAELRGTQRTELTTVYDLADGAVRVVTARTTGRFAVTLSPPDGEAGDALEGTLTLELRSETRRT